MDNLDLERFERKLKKDLNTYEEKKAGTYRPVKKVEIDHIDKGFRVTLVVREKRMSLLDEHFTVVIPTISRLEAVIEAEKKARLQGWPVIAYVYEVERLDQ